MIFHWSLRDSNSPQVSRTLLSIPADLDNAVVWMISTRPFIPISSSPRINPLVTVPNAPITIGITVANYHYYYFLRGIVNCNHISMHRIGIRLDYLKPSNCMQII